MLEFKMINKYRKQFAIHILLMKMIKWKIVDDNK